jgi:small subunit ribosomal protein S17
MNTTDVTNKQSNKGKNFIGTVLSVHGVKTARVEVTHAKKHPIYKKSIRRTKRFACHNEFSDIVAGNTVEICQIRPKSRTKHFSIVRKIK